MGDFGGRGMRDSVGRAEVGGVGELVLGRGVGDVVVGDHAVSKTQPLSPGRINHAVVGSRLHAERRETTNSARMSTAAERAILDLRPNWRSGPCRCYSRFGRALHSWFCRILSSLLEQLALRQLQPPTC